MKPRYKYLVVTFAFFSSIYIDRPAVAVSPIISALIGCLIGAESANINHDATEVKLIDKDDVFFLGLGIGSMPMAYWCGFATIPTCLALNSGFVAGVMATHTYLTHKSTHPITTQPQTKRD